MAEVPALLDAPGALARITALPACGMIALRGDLGDPALSRAMADVAGTALPDRRRIVTSGPHAVAWMSPDELLLFLPDGAAAPAAIRLRAALAPAHVLIADVSDARVLFGIEGRAAREVLAKLCPVDLAPAAFGPGDFFRTRAAQAAAAIWMTHADSMRLMCMRSVADYMAGLLVNAARPGGAVGFFG